VLLEEGDDYLATLIDIFEKRAAATRSAEAKAKARARTKGK
jgi:hypothetical protein